MTEVVDLNFLGLSLLIHYLGLWTLVAMELAGGRRKALEEAVLLRDCHINTSDRSSSSQSGYRKKRVLTEARRVQNRKAQQLYRRQRRSQQQIGMSG